MAITVRPATSFADLSLMLGPKNPQSSVCWCLSHRVDARTDRELVGPQRGEYVERLTRRKVAPGVLGYDGDEVVGWAAVAPRADLPYARSRKIPHVDDLPVWSVLRTVFEACGFALAAETSAVSGGFSGVVMRRSLRQSVPVACVIGVR